MSPTPRRVGRPSWLDLRLVLGVVLVLAAVLIGAKVVADARHTTTQVAVTRDLAAGSILRASDLTTVAAQLPDNAHLYLSDPAKAVGKVLDQPLRRGELLPSAALAARTGRGLTTVNIPLAADAAPVLARGQRIAIWLSTSSCPSTVLLPDVTVQDVHAADAGTFSNGGTGQDVVVSVTPDLAARMVTALAIDNATIRAGVLTGAPAGSGQPLPAIEGCAKSAGPTP